MKIAVCDDQPLELAEIKGLLDEIPEAGSVHTYSDIETFFDNVREGACYDAVLMDIRWDEERTGIDFAEELLRLAPLTKIIYLTAYTADYVEEIFLQKSNLSGFLQKPVKSGQLRRNLLKLCQEKEKEETCMLFVRSGRRTYAIPFQSILYLENHLHNAKIVLADQEYLCSESLEQIRERLDSRFLSCHKSFVANMEYIQEIQKGRIVLYSQKELPISRSREREVKTRFLNYMGEKMGELV